MTIQIEVEQAVKAVCPTLEGISFVDINNPATWVLQFARDGRGGNQSSAEEENAAHGVINNFDIAGTQAKLAAMKRLKETDAKMPRAVEDVIANIQGLRDKLPDEVKTLITERETLRAQL